MKMSGVSHWNRKEGRSGSLTVESSPGQSYQIVTDEHEEVTWGKDSTEAIWKGFLSLSLSFFFFQGMFGGVGRCQGHIAYNYM